MADDEVFETEGEESDDSEENPFDDREASRDRNVTAKKSRDDLTEALAVTKATLELRIEMSSLTSRWTGARYKFFIREGFNEQQAMQLVLNGF
jgi:hypothetical protein